MTIDDVYKYYGTGYQMQKRHGLAQNNFKYWLKIGYIPLSTQLKIEQLTGGELEANFDHAGIKRVKKVQNGEN